MGKKKSIYLGEPLQKRTANLRGDVDESLSGRINQLAERMNYILNYHTPELSKDEMSVFMEALSGEVITIDILETLDQWLVSNTNPNSPASRSLISRVKDMDPSTRAALVESVGC